MVSSLLEVDTFPEMRPPAKTPNGNENKNPPRGPNRTANPPVAPAKTGSPSAPNKR